MFTTTAELKKALLLGGFEVYRSLSDQVILADRVRENLIMDSGVAVRLGPSLRVRITVRAQSGDFPAAAPEELYALSRAQAAPAASRGYVETSAVEVPVRDPGDPSRTLDTWYEVSFERTLGSAEELEAELRYALSLDKTVDPEPHR